MLKMLLNFFAKFWGNFEENVFQRLNFFRFNHQPVLVKLNLITGLRDSFACEELTVFVGPML